VAERDYSWGETEALSQFQPGKEQHYQQRRWNRRYEIALSEFDQKGASGRVHRDSQSEAFIATNLLLAAAQLGESSVHTLLPRLTQRNIDIEKLVEATKKRVQWQ